MLGNAMFVLAQSSSSGGSGGGIIGALFGLVFFVIWMGLLVIILASLWKVYAKAGQPGWAGIVPIYNLYVLTIIIGRPWWWLLLCLIPFVNFIVIIIMMIDLAKSFGKEALFGVGLALLGIVFFPILAFGSAQYQGPKATPLPIG